MTVSISKITAGYGPTPVLREVTATIAPHSITTIIGPNGCGKSTLLKCLARVLPVQAGTITVAGHDVQTIKRRELARLLSFLPQAPDCPAGLRVADLVARGRHPHQSFFHQWSPRDDTVVHRALAQAGISHLADRFTDALSGGQRQRVWLAMILAQDTDTIVLDEPTTYLDLSAAIDVLRLITQLKQELGRTIIMVAHDLNLAARYSDELIVMNQGRIIAHGTPHDVITPELLRDAFTLEAQILPDPITGGPLIVPGQ